MRDSVSWWADLARYVVWGKLDLVPVWIMLSNFFSTKSKNYFHFQTVTKELQLTYLQTLVLLCFNNPSKLVQNYLDIRAATLASDNPSPAEEIELCQTLQSLACGKVRVLVKKSKTCDVSHQDQFEVNGHFRHELNRIKVAKLHSKEVRILL